MSRERVSVNQTCRQLICNLIRTVEEIVKKKREMMIHPAWAIKVFGKSYKDRVALESGLEYTG